MRKVNRSPAVALCLSTRQKSHARINEHTFTGWCSKLTRPDRCVFGDGFGRRSRRDGVSGQEQKELSSDGDQANLGPSSRKLRFVYPAIILPLEISRQIDQSTSRDKVILSPSKGFGSGGVLRAPLFMVSSQKK